MEPFTTMEPAVAAPCQVLISRSRVGTISPIRFRDPAASALMASLAVLAHTLPSVRANLPAFSSNCSRYKPPLLETVPLAMSPPETVASVTMARVEPAVMEEIGAEAVRSPWPR